MQAKKYTGLSDAERSEIEILLKRGCSKREIAQALGRSPNTIRREIRVHSVNGSYTALKAKQKSRASRRSRRYQWRKIEHEPQLRAFIIEHLALPHHWSPDSIAGYLKQQQTELPTVGKDQIYAWLYSAYGQPYCQHLLSKRYHPKCRKANKTDRVMIPNRVSITERPAVVGTRERPGDWEGDTVVSGKKTHSKAALAVTQERMTRFYGATLIPNLKPASFTDATNNMLAGKLTLTLGLDNGIENKAHQDITKTTGADVFFCDPYASHQKGGIENANKMLRRYVPKGCDVNMFTQEQIDQFVLTINSKPRRCLGYKSAIQLANEKGVYLDSLVS
ncbi:IS30 family transposase [Candidatus Saccharibacteria bacterium]|nr:IS30 family transposase [Candidatus Saccharibacteria bacterium]